MLRFTSVLLASATLAQSALWQPAVNTPWQIILNGTLQIDSKTTCIKPEVPVYDIDMFDHQKSGAVANLHRLNKKVICYFSAGSSETWRSDYKQFPKAAIGNPLDDWEGENWLDTNDKTVRNIMLNRIKIAASMGCDAIDPDNVDAYNNDNGFDLTEEDAIDYIEFLAQAASDHGMSTGLKNAMAILPQVAPVIQFAVNEQCALYNECKDYSSFIKTKPVFHIEYFDDKKWKVNPCSEMANSNNFSTVVKYMGLDGSVTYCDGKSYKTATNAGSRK